MMGLIPYAGFDRHENDFSDIVLDHDPRSNWLTADKKRAAIDAERAIILKNSGMSYREIGEQLAAEMGRKPEFIAQSVVKAIRRFNKEAADTRRQTSPKD